MVVPPGALSSVTVPSCERTIASTRESPSPAPPAVACARGPGRPGRTARTRGRRSPRGTPARRRGRRTRRRRTVTVTVVPAGVCLRALVSRLVITWCSRCSSPVDLDGLGHVVGQLEPPPVVGADHPGVVDGLDQQPGQVHRLAVERAAGVEPGQQQHVLDQGGHPRGLLLDLAEGGADVVVVGTAAGQLGVAGDGGQRGAQLVRGVRDELADLLLAAVPRLERGLHVGEQGVERGADLADLGALVGEVVGHPLGEVDVALGQRQRGDRGARWPRPR